MSMRSVTKTRLSTMALAAILAAAGSSARADEGMWLVNQPPTKSLKDRYQFEPTAEWLTAMQRSAVRFSSGGSGSFVSADGLVMTNHHVASDALGKLSTPGHNLLETGFHAKTREEETACPDLELNVLWSIEDVTSKVLDAAKSAANPADANTARRKAIADIEKESKDATGLKSQVVPLYQGGKYHLYRFKQYTDVRLVFAPEQQAAFFGGDNDNFEYPRYNLDCTFFRIYEDGKPLKPEHHLAWSPAGAAENELVMVFGHPGRTQRGLTIDHLKYIRDNDLPARLASLWRSEIKAQTFAGRSAENARIINESLFGIANGRKATTGQYSGLLDPAVWNAKVEHEQKLRSTIEADAKLASEFGGATGPWAQIAASREAAKSILVRSRALGAPFRSSGLLGMAQQIVRLAAEMPKPSRDRLAEYGEARLPSLFVGLYSPAPIYDAEEVTGLENGFLAMAEFLGAEDPAVKTALAGKSPRARAEELVKSCSFKSPDARKKLVEGGRSAVDAAKDPLLILAAALDPELRTLRTFNEDKVESVERASYEKIARARFAVEGDSVYPDATFTLRLAIGTIQGIGSGPSAVPPFTTIGGTFDRAKERAGDKAFVLPESWTKAQSKLKSDTPFNFICTNDIIGGNSGSPVVNRKGELVGLIFDGNIESLVADFAYSGEAGGRAVAVDSRGMIEALTTIYGATGLVKELTGK